MTVLLNPKHAVFLLALLLTGCSQQPSPSTKSPIDDGAKSAIDASQSNAAAIEFEDVSDRMSVRPIFNNGEESDQYTYLEAMGGGIGVLDFDKDGWPDFFVTGGGKIPELGQIKPLPGTLLRNCNGQRFQQISQPAGVDLAEYYSQGIAVGDVNSDGFPDLLVTGFGGLQLFMNQGDGTFVQTAQSMGLEDPYWSTSAGFGDFDNDGAIDLFVAHYVDWSWENHPQCESSAKVRDICPPAAFRGQPDCLFMNQGDGTFVRPEADIGLLPEGKGLGVLCADLNQDGRLDAYVANDTINNYLYLNRGLAKFQEVGVDSGAALDDHGVANGSMGVAILDFDGNLTPDLWVCNYEDETFAMYKNDGDANYRFVSSSAGITVLGTLFVAFGTVAADLDRDGDEDLVVTNGHVLRYPSGNGLAQQPLLLTNNGKGRFAKHSFPADHYFSTKWRGRGLVQLDFDRDGDVDLGFSNVNQSAAVLENRSKNDGQWCSLELVGQLSNRDAIGSQIIFTTVADGKKRQYARWIAGGGSYMSQSAYTVQWACPPNEKLQQIEIKWPSGNQQLLPNMSINQSHVIVESLESVQ